MPNQAHEEFLIIAVPDSVSPGTNLRLVAVAENEEAARAAIDSLGGGTLGRIALLRRVAVFNRRPTVESVEVDEPLLST